MGGILTVESDRSPPLGPSFQKAIEANLGEGRLDIGCVATQGHFVFDEKSGQYQLLAEGKPATAFLFKLIEKLHLSGTVPMIDVDAYAKWLVK